ncbi:unnamed protein product [Lactuca saligna]|uniref:Uncharacterized protein n=1 Tax=Lactuca saligna TaxID=75948 RepID=A0AA35V409_LACSI|nr:unnamed protein product [Lactuca saligna]
MRSASFSYFNGFLSKQRGKEGGEGEKSSTLLLLLVKHFEIALHNCVARLSTAVLINFRHSCYSTLTNHVDRHPLVSLLSSKQSWCLDLSSRTARPRAAIRPNSAAAKPNHQQLRCLAFGYRPTQFLLVLERQAPHGRSSTLASSRLASQPDSIIAASSACERQALHARLSTLASILLTSQPDSIIAASPTCEVQYARLESPGFSTRLHYSSTLRMRGSVPLLRVAWLLSPTPL